MIAAGSRKNGAITIPILIKIIKISESCHPTALLFIKAKT